jgi:hypothetical protein
LAGVGLATVEPGLVERRHVGQDERDVAGDRDIIDVEFHPANRLARIRLDGRVEIEALPRQETRDDGRLRVVVGKETARRIEP